MHTGKMASVSLVIALTAVTSPALAAEGDPASLLGRGSAGLADPRDNAGIRRCMACVVLSEEYVATLDVGFPPGWQLGGSARDTRSSMLGAGVVYTRDSFDGALDIDEMPGWTLPDADLDNPTIEQSVRVGLGYAMLARRLGLGLAGVWDRKSSALSSTENTYELDVSLGGRVTNTLVLGATARDLLPDGTRDPLYEVGAWWAAGEVLGLALDGGYDSSAASFGEGLTGRAGAELVLEEAVAFRGGYEQLSKDPSAFGLGIGVLSEAGRLDYGYRYDLLGQQSWHQLALVLNL